MITGNGPILNPYLELFHELESHSPQALSQVRKKLIWAFSWAVPNQDAIQALAELSPLVEIGAGTGYWTWLLKQAGAKIRAFDLNPNAPPEWSEVLACDLWDPNERQDECLFLCWPPLDEGMAINTLARFKGEHVAYVGEWRGRTGDPEFHDRLDQEYNQIRVIDIPRYPGFADRLYLFRRKSPNER